MLYTTTQYLTVLSILNMKYNKMKYEMTIDFRHKTPYGEKKTRHCLCLALLDSD